MKWIIVPLMLAGVLCLAAWVFFIAEINKYNASQKPSVVELEFITTDADKLLCRLNKEIIGKRVWMSKAIWNFNERDETILEKPWAFRRQGIVAVLVRVYSKKPDGTLLAGSMEVGFKERDGEMQFNEIINRTLEIVKEYK